MYRYALGILCTLCVLPSVLFAQGMNNTYPLDSIDIKAIVDMLGFHVFKFPVHTTSGKKVYLNYSTERYENGALVDSYNQYKELLKAFPKEMVLGILPPVDTSVSFVRLYWRDISQGEILLRLSINEFSMDVRWDSDSTNWGAAQYRAMAYSSSEPLGKRVPIAVRYAHTADKQMISCPGNASIEDIVQLYGYVIVVYIEAVEADEE